MIHKKHHFYSDAERANWYRLQRGAAEITQALVSLGCAVDPHEYARLTQASFEVWSYCEYMLGE